ncbi:MAG: hypothetical protein R6X09_04940 [Bacteroidales bacterium]
MKFHFLLLAMVLIFGTSAIALGGRMIPGNLYLLQDGTKLSCAIEYSTGQGKMEASNPKTGEKFTGMYTGVFITDDYAECKGVLIGDKGTVIFLNMKINVGGSPFGFGDGIDNNNNKYQYHTLR